MGGLPAHLSSPLAMWRGLYTKATAQRHIN